MPIGLDLIEVPTAQQKAQALLNAVLELNAQIAVIKGARIEKNALQAEYDDQRKQWEDCHVGLVANLNASKTLIEKEESRLRELTLAAFKLDPTNKKPARGVGVRVSEAIQYDLKEALEYAKRELPGMLEVVLDNKAFYDFMARRLEAKKAFPIKAEVLEHLAATISKEL